MIQKRNRLYVVLCKENKAVFRLTLRLTNHVSYRGIGIVACANHKIFDRVVLFTEVLHVVIMATHVGSDFVFDQQWPKAIHQYLSRSMFSNRPHCNNYVQTCISYMYEKISLADVLSWPNFDKNTPVFLKFSYHYVGCKFLHNTYQDNALQQKATLQLMPQVFFQSIPNGPRQHSLKRVHWVVSISLWDE